MVMNNNGQIIFYSLMLGVTILILVLALAYPVKQQVDIARSPDNMNCSSSTLTTSQNIACIATDLTLFYFIGTLLFIAGAVILARIIL